MKKLNRIGDDAEKMANGISYYIVMAAIFLIMFFTACYILNQIIDPCLAMLENLAENSIRMAMAVVKILLVSILLFAIYKVFLESNNTDESHRDTE